jgi:hypothetical protein
MTPQEMADLLRNFGTPEKVRSNQIRLRRYNVIVKTKNDEIRETYEMVTLKAAREIRKEAHEEDLIADIIEDWTIDYNDKEINPKPIVSSIVNIPSKNNASQPTYTEAKQKLRSAKAMARAQDNIARSTKNAKCEYHIFRIINKELKIDIQDTEAKITDFLIKNGNMEAFKIIYCGIAESWGKEI